MKRSMTLVAAALFAALSVSCATTPFSGVSSMRGADVAAADSAPAIKAYAGKKPGLQQVIARTYETQPPLIPHAVENFDEITLEDNQCTSCHSVEKYKEKKAPKIGDSHYGAVGGKQVMKMDRYQCNNCHVPQADAKPLVGNSFVGDLAPAKR